jgi:hypothetical protein
MGQKALQIVLESTNILDLKALKDEITNAYLEDATVTVSLYDASDVVVPGADTLSLAHVTGTSGSAVTYRATLSASLALVAGSYTAKVIATAADGSKRTFPVPVTAVALPA